MIADAESLSASPLKCLASALFLIAVFAYAYNVC